MKGGVGQEEGYEPAVSGMIEVFRELFLPLEQPHTTARSQACNRIVVKVR